MSPRDLRNRLARDGYAIVHGVLASKRVTDLAQSLESGPSVARIRTRAGIPYGNRNALRVPEVQALAASDSIRVLVEPVLGPAAFPVRAILFDKLPGANWGVPWHQDLAIAVRESRDVPGFHGWSTKAGVPHVHAPSCVLEGMLTLRVHLDDAGEANGPLRVVPGSHGHGKLTPERVIHMEFARDPLPGGLEWFEAPDERSA